jgi:serine phosphatase RsbU (regulator of sigma subunit)
MMGQLRSALRAYALDGGSPAAVLERLNRFLLSLSWDSMATALVLLVEPATGRLTYANAGHPPPLIMGPDGVARSLKGSLSVPLGALDVAGYEEGTATLEPGATLVLYTDGLVERRDATLDQGLVRLVEAGTELAGVPVQELSDALLARMDPEYADDVALVALHVGRAGPPVR